MHDHARALPEIVRDLASIRTEHASLLAVASAGDAPRKVLEDLARSDAELCAFDDMCRRTRTQHLMSAGLLWGDELRHPARPGKAAFVRLRDQVEIDGRTVSISQATRIVAEEAKKGVAIGDWTCGGIRLGSALGLEHPGRDAAATPASAAATSEPAQASLF